MDLNHSALTVAANMLRKFFILTVVAFASVHGEYDCDQFPTSEQVTSCCAVPRSAPPSMWKKCLPKGESSTKEQFCSGHCLFAEQNLITEGGELDYPAAERYFKDFVNENATWTSIVENVLSACTKLVASRDLKQLPNYHCASKADFYLHCIHDRGIYACPDEYWSSSTECQESKSLVKNCPLPDVEAKPFVIPAMDDFKI